MRGQEQESPTRTVAVTAVARQEGVPRESMGRRLAQADGEDVTAGWIDWRSRRRLHVTPWMLTPMECEAPYYEAFTREPEPAR